MRNKLRQLRKSKGVTQTFLSHQLGYTHASGYSNIENGRTGLKLEHARKLAEIFNVSIDELVEDNNESFLAS